MGGRADEVKMGWDGWRDGGMIVGGSYRASLSGQTQIHFEPQPNNQVELWWDVAGRGSSLASGT